MSTTKHLIATFGSHSALQILKGAREEGFRTLCICQPDRRKLYESFGVADEIVEIKDFKNFFDIEDELIRRNAILIPHGSLVEFLGPTNVEKIRMPYYGTRTILKWEFDRLKEREWLLKAGLRLPKILKSPEEINHPVIIKFHGAGGGKGYFIANTPKEFYERYNKYKQEKEYVIQEYIVGVPIYIHYFYSRLRDELEIMSFDKRYESNADSIGRIAARDQMDVNIQTSYTITGNIPMVVRESLLPEIMDMGERVVKASREIETGGLFGPFCLEAIVDNRLKFYVFEISARIVAGTNPYINGSPYTWIKYNEPMSTGRRIARDIREAIEQGKLEKVLG